MKWTKRLLKGLAVGSVVSVAVVGGGCLSRPVGTQPPTTKVNFTSTISQAQVDKVDLLFLIDNSSSMGDKQAILSQAVPNLITGLLQPKCVDANDKQSGTAVADPTGNKDNHYGCPAGTDPEFKPVTDMHLAVLSSSLGSFGGDICPDSLPRQNDHAHLLSAQKGGGTIADAQPSGFLAWFPNNQDNQDASRHPPPATPVTSFDTLNTDFQNVVVGVDQTGCGFEAQLESWYHFLIAPDPWQTITVDGAGQADYGSAVDIDLLRQRADFLRPDSLVAIISLSDEDDSSPDPLSVSGQGWAFDSNQFPGSTVFRADQKSTTAPRGTSVCDKNPGDKDCTSCAFSTNPNDPQQNIKGDSACAGGIYLGPNDDNLNARWSQQLVKRTYGIDPQYPISRYVDGLTKTHVADRANEHPITPGNGRRNIGAYAPTPKCTNPLFASKLPRNPGDELCALPPSTRTSDLIFFAHIGGVPNQLLYKTNGSKPDATQRIDPPNWDAILGHDPANYDYTGIDIHMVESKGARPGLPPPSATVGDNGTDPIHGREWDTAANDLQFACTFDLPMPRTCAANDNSCQCPPDGSSNPPLCGSKGQQTKAKAYPTIREFMVVRALGENGIIASLCPIQLTDQTAPDYGYQPAVAAIIERLKNALTTQCLPQRLTRDTGDQTVPCLVLAQLGDPNDNCGKYGLSEPPPDILAKFLEQQKALSGNVADGGTDLSKLPVCEVPQQVEAPGGTCKDDPKIEWCYVENGGGQTPAGRCAQALIFSSGSAALGGARFSLQCIQQFSAGQAAGDSDAGP